MKKRLFRVVSVFLLVLCPFALFAGGQNEGEDTGSRESQEPIVLRLAHMAAVDHITDRTTLLFEKLVEEKTGGNVDVQLFPAGQLGSEKEYVKGMELGTVDMCVISTGYMSNLVPEAAVITFPYIFENWDHVKEFYWGEVGQDLAQLFVDKTGIRVVMYGCCGFRDMATAGKKIESIEDFKGVKFRSPEIPVYMEMFNAIGASPTPIPYTELYSALQTRVVDGAETDPANMIYLNLFEIADYVIKTGHIYGGDVIVMDDNAYAKLPAEYQKAVDEAAIETFDWHFKTIIEENNAAYDMLKEKGMELITIDKTPLREACFSVWDLLSEGSPETRAFADRIVGILE